MKKYNVTGMSCAACSARVEKAVNQVEGVTSCSVSLLTNSMGVEGTASEQAVIQAVIDAGYGASAADGDSSKKTAATGDSLKDTETPKLIKRLCWSIFFVLILMYFSMGHMMWNWPVPAFFNGNHVAMGLVQLLLAVIVMVINQKFFINGFKGIIHGAPNMDTLVALGSSASFIWSTYVLFAMTGAQAQGDAQKVNSLMGQFYFESAAMILALITIGKTLEARSKGKTTDALKELMKLSPETAVIIQNDKEVQVPVEQVIQGDVFVVRPGSQIPVDGVVIEGSSAVNEAALTGESIPVDKVVNSKVSAGTVNQSGFIKCRATKVGKDTTLSQIIQMVSDAAATKAPIAKIADKVSGVFVPAVISIAVVTTVVWLLVSKDFGYALARGISVLVISCPCALGLATPVAIMVGNGLGARNGILFKTAESLEQTGKADFVVLDKTGTVTEGKPVVVGYKAAENIGETELIQIALDLEKKSEHPLAKAIVEFAENKGLKASEVQNFEAVAGRGVKAQLEGKALICGNKEMLSFIDGNNGEQLQKYFELTPEGATTLFFARDKEFLGVIFVADTIKKDSAQAVSELEALGLQVVLLTGDNEKTARAIAQQAGIKKVIAGVLPGEKAAEIKKLQAEGKVVMVGDGINDAPALTQADTGIAIGNGTDVALDSADVVLMNNSLLDVAAAIRLSRKTLVNIKENLFWAFFYNIIGIPLAAGVWIPLFGWELNPMFGAAAMSLSSFCVVTNALRLNFAKIRNIEKSAEPAEETKNKVENKKRKEKPMKKTIKIEGMMCEHCEAHVKKALEAVDGVESATASHVKGIAVVILTKAVDDAALKAAVEAADYKVLGIN